MIKWLDRSELLDLLESIKMYYTDSEILDEFVLYMSTDTLQEYIEDFCRLHDIKINYKDNDIEDIDVYEIDA